MRHIPLLAEEGWLRHQKNAAKPQRRRGRARSASAIARSRNSGQFGTASKASRTDHYYGFAYYGYCAIALALRALLCEEGEYDAFKFRWVAAQLR